MDIGFEKPSHVFRIFGRLESILRGMLLVSPRSPLSLASLVVRISSFCKGCPSFCHVWSDDEEGDDDGKIKTVVWSDDKAERAYRRRALTALGYEVVLEDIYRTELRRATRKAHENELDKAFLTSRFLFRNSLRIENDQELPDSAMQEIQRIAQEMGLLGIGLAGELSYSERGEEFFPEMLELKWPPEGRLVERDCTCDLWDKIRCK